MTRRLARLLVVAAVGIVGGSGCGGPDPGGRERSPSASGVPSTVSSARLAALRTAAGLPSCPASDAAHREPGDLPELTLTCLADGSAVDVAGLVGRPYVVNFWASTCEPCIEEVPILQEVADEAAGRVQVLGVNYLDVEERALLAAPDLGVGFPTLFDPDGLLGQAFPFPGLPATFFVAADGAVVGQQVGAFDSADELRAAIAEHLGVAL